MQVRARLPCGAQLNVLAGKEEQEGVVEEHEQKQVKSGINKDGEKIEMGGRRREQSFFLVGGGRVAGLMVDEETARAAAASASLYLVERWSVRNWSERPKGIQRAAWRVL